MSQLDILLEKMKEVSDQKLNETFIGALQLAEEQRGTIDFVFWLCYMAETDLNYAIQGAWEKSNKFFNKDVNDGVRKILRDNLKGYALEDFDVEKFLDTIEFSDKGDKTLILDAIRQNYNPKRIFTDVDDLQYFIDKIRMYEVLIGKNKCTKLLWKISDIRNNLSHNRLENLKYGDESLYLRATKEKIIEDYFRTIFEGDLSKSAIWNSLTDEQKVELEKMIL